MFLKGCTQRNRRFIDRRVQLLCALLPQWAQDFLEPFTRGLELELAQLLLDLCLAPTLLFLGLRLPPQPLLISP